MKNIPTFTITTPADNEIVMTRTFEAPRAVVFEAWTNAEHVSKWWDPSGAPLLICEIDLRRNGAFRWVNNAGDGEYSFTGVYREIEPPERLVITARLLRAGPDLVATLVFREERGTTTLTMTIKCKSREDRNAVLEMGIGAGTAQTLENLAKYMDEGRI